MAHALALAKDGVGDVWPNPSVGCVILNNGKIVGEGFTAKGGRPHAEKIALDQAGESAKGGIAYVTLEPCAHHGTTPPCAEALVNAGLSKVIYALKDPDPRVSGKGQGILSIAGVETLFGLMEEEAFQINEGFFKKVETGLPLITLKFATSKDGKIAREDGTSKWITNEKSRTFGHELRAKNDAILVGVGTVLADNPSLTCRIEGKEQKSPVRIILDRTLRTPLESNVVKTANETPTWIITEEENGAEYEAQGVKVIKVDDCFDIKTVLIALGEMGLTRILVEGGSQIHSSFFQANLVDKMAWFRAPKAIGKDGLDAISGFDITKLNENKQYKLVAQDKFDEDVLEIYVAKG